MQDEEDNEEKIAGDEEIYEFEDYGDEDGEVMEKSDDKPKRGTSTGSSMTHMCSFCNYSTNKRYLLARHMKV